MNAGVTILEPKLIEIGNEPIGKAVIGTVRVIFMILERILLL